ncbi:response regulator [Salinirubellus sp. GCM10025818]|uniref:response regulator n=1 Tax=Salinirubellus TaxID=2162630 RepID=UPI0030CCDC7C
MCTPKLIISGPHLGDRRTDPSITVLLVDDDEGLVELVQEYVRQRHGDITVRAARSGDGVLAELETTDDVDCVVSDYQMPEMDGIELLQAVRARWPDLPFILFTGQGSEDIAERAIKADATDYVQKGTGTTQFAVLVNRIRNATAQYRAETELRRLSRDTEPRFRLFVETTDDQAIILLDEEGHVRTWNAGAEQIKGYESDEIVGEHFSIFYPEVDVEAGAPERSLHEAAEEGRVSDEGWRVHRDGSQFWANVTITALREEGELVGYAKVLRDGSDRKRERELLERKEQLEGFIASISHDLRNPLGVARGNVEAARDTGDPSRLDAAEAALDRATRLLAYVAKAAEEGEHAAEPEPVDFGDAAEATWNALEADEATLTVEGSGTVVADRWRLGQLLENLFANSVEHAGPDVTVSVGLLDDRTGFYVEDDGPGIPESTRAKVFEMGYSGAAEGTGYGLAICGRIAEAHGWEIDVTDGTDGGARFDISGVQMG